jgi:hypothetical protein
MQCDFSNISKHYAAYPQVHRRHRGLELGTKSSEKYPPRTRKSLRGGHLFLTENTRINKSAVRHDLSIARSLADSITSIAFVQSCARDTAASAHC